MSDGIKLSDYSEQVKDGVPRKELTDWDKVPQVIKPQKNKRPGKKTALQKRQHPKGWFPEEVRIEAVALYACHGNVAEVARIMNMNPATVRTWKQTEWWNEMLRRVQMEDDELLDSKFSKVVNRAVDEINDRLENGEFVYNAKLDKVVRVKAKMRDVAFVAATNLDKRQLLRGLPTNRTEKVSNNEVLERLAKQFAAFTSAKTIEAEVVPIEQVIYSE